MAISVNRVILVGRVGADPEAKGRDSSMVTFSLATSRSWKDRTSGERREDTQWHKIVVFDEHSARFCRYYVKKGDLVYVQGCVETRKWEKSPGEELYLTEIVVRPFDGSVQAQSQSSGQQRESSGRSEPRREERRQESPTYGGGAGYGGGFSRDIDDDIPFAPEWR